MILEINEIYRTYDFDPTGNDPEDIVKIIDIVDPDTIEYELGARFFSHMGYCYDDSGIRLYQAAAPINKNRNLKRLIEPTDLIHTCYAKPRMPLNTFMLTLNYKECISVTDPEFNINLGGVYVDRMGFFRFIEHGGFTRCKNEDGPEEWVWKFISGNTTFDVNGRTNIDKSSMYDIVLQKV